MRSARYYEVESPGLVLLSIEKRSGVLPEYWNSQKRAL